CLNFVLNLILIPYFKAEGAAVSSLATQFFTAGMWTYLCYRTFKFRLNYRLILVLTLFTGGVIISGILCSNFIKNPYVSIGLMCAFSGVWALVTGLISLKSIMRFLKYS